MVRMRKQNRRGTAGFQLAEVTVTLAISSFMMITILGLLPLGLKVIGKAKADLAIDKIRTQIQLRVDELKQDELASLDGQTLYYSSTAKPLGEEAPSSSSSDCFRVSLNTEAITPTIFAGGDDDQASAAAEIYVVQVEVSHYPERQSTGSFSLHTVPR